MTRGPQSSLERSISYEVLYGRPDHLRIFVSSKMHDHSLDAERLAAIGAIKTTRWHQPWAWEISAAAGPYSSRKLCTEIAHSSDGLVLIVSDELTSVTRGEYFAARRGGVPAYIFVKDGVRQSEELGRFIRRRQKQRAVTVKFRNLAELRTEIRSALKASIIRDRRTSILRDRGTR